MRVRLNPLDAIKGLFGGNQAPTEKAVYFNSGPSAADTRAADLAAAEEAKRKSLAEQANKQGAASSLITSPDLGSDFAGLKTRKTLLGGA